jgi:sulfite reductase alpha subunit-like flavoprotein
VEYAAQNTVADFIVDYALHGRPRLDSLLSGVPLTKVRTYVIASPPKKKRGHLEIIVENHMFGPNKDRAGLCSSYLRNIGTGRITVKIEEGPAQHPRDKDTPLIIIAVGVGIATAFSLLEFRKYSDGQFGPALLVCEFRKEAHIPLIQRQVHAYVEAKLLGTVIWAFSEEEGAQFRSWQEALRQNIELIWPLWLNDKSRVYLSGNLGAAANDLHGIFVKMTMDEGGLRDEEASAWAQKHAVIIEDFTGKYRPV